MTTATTVPKAPAPSMLPRLAAAILPVAVTVAVGTLATGDNIEGWYATIRKPSFNPPDWLFPIAWTVLYTMIAIALWRLIGARPIEGPSRASWRLAIAAFLTQLALNAAWTPVFFAAHALGAALVVAIAMLVMVLWTIRQSWRFDRFAACLLMPYAVWVGFASVLNAAIYWMN